jgi:hypothetical protein
VITNNIATLSTDVLLSTLFTDFTGFFTPEDADALVARVGSTHYRFLPIIQGESRLLALFTSKNDMPLKRLPDINDRSLKTLEAAGISTVKDLLSADPVKLQACGIDAEANRKAAIKLLFP